MPISINMTGVETKASALPAGYYQAAVSKCEQRKSRAGNDYLSWTFSIQAPEEFVSRKAFYNTSLQQQALWNLKRTLIALGFAEGDLAGDIDFEPSDVLGVECTLVIVEDEYNGETVGRVDQVLPAGTEEA